MREVSNTHLIRCNSPSPQNSNFPKSELAQILTSWFGNPYHVQALSFSQPSFNVCFSQILSPLNVEIFTITTSPHHQAHSQMQHIPNASKCARIMQRPEIDSTDMNFYCTLSNGDVPAEILNISRSLYSHRFININISNTATSVRGKHANKPNESRVRH